MQTEMGRRQWLAGLAAAGVLAALPAQAQVWVDLGSRQAGLRRDPDRFLVGAGLGGFIRLRVRVVSNAVHIGRVVVTYGNGEAQAFTPDAVVTPASDGRSIDLAGGARTIRHVDIAYRRVPGGGAATVTLLGLRP